MKKIVCLLLILVIAFPLVSCTKKHKAYINDVRIQDYIIVYSDEDSDYSKRAAEYIGTKIEEKTGHKISIVEDDAAKAEHEIVVGETNRAISKKLDADTEGLEFAILADGGSIALEGDYFIIAAAAYFFIDSYVPGGSSKTIVPSEVKVHQPIVKQAKSFILLIGDGMGYYQTRLFEQIENNIEYGDGEDTFYGYLLPYLGFSITESLSGTTDSAAGGTALSCGTKTINRYVGMDKDKNKIKNMTELAYELGKSAAVMSTEKDTGATPSTFYAHVEDRNYNGVILAHQSSAYENYGTIVECGYDYYTRDDVNGSIETRISNVLSQVSANSNGFFLMYEEAYIDKHCDDMDIEKAFMAMVRFNQAIGRFMEFCFYNPDTFLLITADHETGGLAPDENGVLTFSTKEHTGANVPIFAYGYGAELFDGVEIQNIQIAHTIAALMGDSNFGDQSIYQSLTKGK